MQRLRIAIEKALDHFTTDESQYIREIIDFSQDNIPKKSRYVLFKSANSIDDNTTQYRKDLFTEMIEQVFIRDTADNLDVIASGENYFIELRLRKDEDLSGSILLARLDEDDSALSDEFKNGTSSTIQRVDCIDLDLTSGVFHKINVLTEEPASDGSASGDGYSLVNTVYLYVEPTVDQ